MIRKVSCRADKTSKDEFIDLSKDGSGQWRTSKEGHKGQFIYVDCKDNPRIKPVRVFESVAVVKKQLMDSRECEEVIGFFRSKCVIALSEEVIHGKYRISPGRYIVNTLKQDGRCGFSASDGTKFLNIPLKKLIPAGFERVTS